jgi:serralysin
MAQSVTSVTATGNDDIDGLLFGVKWAGAITYSFPDAAADYPSYGSAEPTNGFAQISSAQQTVVHRVMDLVESYTNLDISYAGTGTSDIRLGQSKSANPTAYAYLPGTNRGGDVWFGDNYDYRSPKLGDYYYVTHIHEIGHALGLKHAQDAGGVANVAVPSDHDALEYTVMSYRPYVGGPTTGYTNEQYGFPTTYMMNDILALQTMYGADYTTQSGDTVYTWNATTGEWSIDGVGQGRPGGTGAPTSANRVFMTVWDGGGNDTYNLSNYTTAVNIDLNPGAYSITSATQLAYLGSGHYAHGNVYNAYLFNGDARSYIENAIGGSGADTITGNAIANRLDGRAGNDTLTGNGGADTFVYGQSYGQDTVTDFATAGAGHDIIDLSAFTSIGSMIGLNITQVGANAVIDFGGGQKLTLNNGNVANLTNDHFIFGGTPDPTGAAPTDISLSNATVSESASVGSAIGNLGVTDADSGQTYLYSLVSNPGGRFAISGTTLILAAALSYEAAASYQITIRVTDSGYQTYDETFTINVSNNTANSVVEGSATGTAVGVTALALDPNGGTVTYSLLDDAGGRFQIDATTGVVTVLDGSKLDFDAATSHQVTVSASDGNLSTTTDFTINVAELVGVTMNGSSAANVMNGTQTGDTFYGNGGNDTITALGGNDFLYGGAGNDTLYGGDGNDLLDGGAGNDKMYGGADDDRYIVNSKTDLVVENADEGTDTVDSSITWTLSANVENLTLTGSSAINGTGNDLDNVITGNAKNNVLAGLAGADTLIGNGGSDTASYAASDTGVDVSLQAGTASGGHAEGDTLIGISNLTGSAFNDTLEGNAGANTLVGGAGIDTVSYEHAGGAVTVNLSKTSAQATGGAGSDKISGFENLTGSNFSDVLTGSTGANVIYGLDGNDNISGGNGNDTLYGGEGNDTLNGGAGNDIIVGGPGADTLIGGTGNDAFVFAAPDEGLDTITDFARSADWLEISAAGFGGGLTAGAAPELIVGSDVLAAVGSGSTGYFFLDNTGTDSGKLYWDPTGGSGDDAIALVQLNGITSLLPSDLHIV